jgi:7,8-dihydropterin-6-yl-methyl-4-(beta-D-ribofuranosyl)aminobenzene 5'-phosphate synthase
MKLSVLTENTSSAGFTAEFGLSYFIEKDGKNILFDTGHTDIFLKNAEKLKLDIQKTDLVVLSHGHWDHGDGLKYLNSQNLLCHPAAFIKRYHKRDHSYIGLELSLEEVKQKFNLSISSKPWRISENVWFLGEIPRSNDFESQTTSFIDEKNDPDFVPDDSALAIIENNELIVITGCSHSGICNIVEYAKEVTGTNKLNTVMGGFHLKRNDDQTRKTIRYFKQQVVKNILPSHCTQLPALAAFYDEFKIKQVQAGMVFNFN